MRIFLLALSVITIFAMSTHAGMAQVEFNAPAPKIAIVDVQSIMREALAAKALRKQMDDVARREQTKFAEQEKALRARDQELQQQRAILTPEVFAQRQQELQADIRRLQQSSRNLRVTLDQAFRRARDKVQLVLIDEVRKLSSEIDVNLVMPRSQIVIAVDAFDISNLALERLNKRLPSIELNLTQGDSSNQTNR